MEYKTERKGDLGERWGVLINGVTSVMSGRRNPLILCSICRYGKKRNGFAITSILVIKYICISIRCIELFPSTYEEAKLRIMSDARINAKQFVGDDDIDKDMKVETNNHVDKRHSRSRSRQRSRSTSRGSRITEANLCAFETSSYSRLSPTGRKTASFTFSFASITLTS